VGPASPAEHPERSTTADFDRAVADVLLRLAPGEVVTYGWVALEAGYPRRHRAVGTFLARRYTGPNWWRVVASNGHLRAPNLREQAEQLRAEGVVVVDGRVAGPVQRPWA
jgi:methylated-DNA-protein-cysteine methyltransferase-like protein